MMGLLSLIIQYISVHNTTQILFIHLFNIEENLFVVQKGFSFLCTLFPQFVDTNNNILLDLILQFAFSNSLNALFCFLALYLQ